MLVVVLWVVRLSSNSKHTYISDFYAMYRMNRMIQDEIERDKLLLYCTELLGVVEEKKGLKYQLNVVNPLLPELLQSMNSFSLHWERHSLKGLLLCVNMDVCLQLKNTHIYAFNNVYALACNHQSSQERALQFLYNAAL